MKYLMGQTTVTEFDRWHSTFKGNASHRAEHGERGYQIFQIADDPNEIVLLFEWDDDSDPRAYFESDETRETMSEAGVISPPDLTELEKVEQQSPQQSPA